MNALIVNLLNPLLSRIPPRWMTGTGLLALLIVYVLHQNGMIDDSAAAWLEGFTGTVTGVGVIRHQETVLEKIKSPK